MPRYPAVARAAFRRRAWHHTRMSIIPAAGLPVIAVADPHTDRFRTAMDARRALACKQAMSKGGQTPVDVDGIVGGYRAHTGHEADGRGQRRSSGLEVFRVACSTWV